MKIGKHHIAAYDGKLVEMSYIPDPKREYHFAAMRIVDNGFDGHVVTPKGEVFEVLRGKRTSRRLADDERTTVLTKLGVTVE